MIYHLIKAIISLLFVNLPFLRSDHYFCYDRDTYDVALYCQYSVLVGILKIPTVPVCPVFGRFLHTCLRTGISVKWHALQSELLPCVGNTLKVLANEKYIRGIIIMFLRANVPISEGSYPGPVHTQTNSVVLVRKRTIPTERPPHVGEVSDNFCG
jgi:hypothetical protein